MYTPLYIMLLNITAGPQCVGKTRTKFISGPKILCLPAWAEIKEGQIVLSGC